MNAAGRLGKKVGKKAACNALGVSRATYYRHTSSMQVETMKRPAPPLALTENEQQQVLDELHSERFWDQSPMEVYATLLDEGRYLCSIRTMYRILDKHNEVKERRRQVSRPRYQKPELLATGPNQVWSWDITKLKGPAKWTYFYLYVILDIYSRYVVGWMVAHREQAALAKRLIEDTCAKQNIVKKQLTLHADRGSSMKSKVVANLLADLGVTKTLKYSPGFPDRFGCIEDARTFCRSFFSWYNREHKHSGIGQMTPEQVHYGQAHEILNHRSRTLKAAFDKFPSRFKGKVPRPRPLPEAAWINKPSPDLAETPVKAPEGAGHGRPDFCKARPGMAETSAGCSEKIVL